MHVRFDGLGAGLGVRSRSGDVNDLTNFTIVCSCGAELGCASKYSRNDAGIAAVACDAPTNCGNVGFIRMDPPPIEVLRVVNRAEVEERLRAARLAALSDEMLGSVGLVRTCGACADKLVTRAREARSKATSIETCCMCRNLILLEAEVCVFAPAPVLS